MALMGTHLERYRLYAWSANREQFASLVFTGHPTDPGQIQVIDEGEVGCLGVEPVYLNLGEVPAGEPAYGTVTVTNACPVDVAFMQVMSDNPRFTPASLLTEQPLAPGMEALVSVTYFGPGGTEELGQLFIEFIPDPAVPPEQVPLMVMMRAASQP
jgi:hypothetical protein